MENRKIARLFYHCPQAHQPYHQVNEPAEAALSPVVSPERYYRKAAATSEVSNLEIPEAVAHRHRSRNLATLHNHRVQLGASADLGWMEDLVLTGNLEAYDVVPRAEPALAIVERDLDLAAAYLVALEPRPLARKVVHAVSPVQSQVG